MSNFLFPNFLSDPAQYSKATAYWLNLWKAVIRRAGRVGEWRSPWMKNEYADGTPIMDGNPIFSAVSDRRHRAVRIIQEEKTSPDHVELDCWVDYFGEKTDPGAVVELVIACVPSPRTTARVEDLLFEWVTQGQVTLPVRGEQPEPVESYGGDLGRPELEYVGGGALR